jgi:hypothetical protein
VRSSMVTTDLDGEITKWNNTGPKDVNIRVSRDRVTTDTVGRVSKGGRQHHSRTVAGRNWCQRAQTTGHYLVFGKTFSDFLLKECF